MWSVRKAAAGKYPTRCFLGRTGDDWCRIARRKGSRQPVDWTSARRMHQAILLSLCSLCPLWLILKTVSKSLTTEGSEGSENDLISMAGIGVAWAGEMLLYGRIQPWRSGIRWDIPCESRVVRTATARREPRPTDVRLVE